MSIQSVQRAFDILQIINKESNADNAATIAQCIDLPRTTVVRMLATLEEVGAVNRVGESNRFQIGSMLRGFGQPKRSSEAFKAMARPFLSKLAEETGETVYLCMPVGNQVTYLDQIDSQHHILLRNWTGSYFPAHTTAAGKLFLAYMSNEKLETYLSNPLEQFTTETVTEPDKVRAYVQEILQTGVAWTHGQTEKGLVGVAAPVFDENGRVILAISLGGPAFRFPEDPALAARQVIQTARAVSEQVKIEMNA